MGGLSSRLPSHRSTRNTQSIATQMLQISTSSSVARSTHSLKQIIHCLQGAASACSPSWAWTFQLQQVHSSFWETCSCVHTTSNLTSTRSVWASLRSRRRAAQLTPLWLYKALCLQAGCAV